MIFIYKFLGILLIPFIKLNVILRIIKGKENRLRYKERFGEVSIKRPSKKLIWIHAASIGEFKSADILIKHLHKDYTVLITTTTLSAANYAKEYYGDRIIHQFAPLDVEIWVKKFLFFWKPHLIIWIESDLWPITLCQIKKRKIKSILINVRISPKSYLRWKKINFFYKQITSCFDEIFAQSKKDQARISDLTKRKIKYIGNLKLTLNSKIDKLNTKNYFYDDKDIITLMFASTHQEEEFDLILLIKELLQKNKIKIIFAPRHPEKYENTLSLFKKKNISTNLESSEKIQENEVFVINSFGNLSKYFLKSNIVFLGGSLKYKGGHNPIEPASYNCAILSGPHTYNWHDIYEDMVSNNACVKVKNISDLKNVIEILINDKIFLKKMISNSNKYSEKKFFDNKKLFEVIYSKLSEASC